MNKIKMCYISFSYFQVLKIWYCMNNFFNNLRTSIKQKSKLLILLISLSVAAIVLGIFAGIKFLDGVLVVDLSNIAYIKFLKAEISFINLFFRICFATFIFAFLIYICNVKPFLTPLSILFYLYFVYSQVVIIVSITLIYGFLNSIILVLLIAIYTIILYAILLFFFLEANCHCNSFNFFKESLNSNFLTYLTVILVATFVFCIVLNILKSFVILLIY